MAGHGLLDFNESESEVDEMEFLEPPPPPPPPRRRAMSPPPPPPPFVSPPPKVPNPANADNGKAPVRVMAPEVGDGDVYTAERILQSRNTPSGETEYLIRWWGHGATADTWEPAHNIPDHLLKARVVLIFKKGENRKVEN